MIRQAIRDEIAALGERVASGDVAIADELRRLDARPAADADLHAELARLAEVTGDLQRAVLEYNCALKCDMRRPDILWRLAELRLDQGETERATRCLKRLLDGAPEHEAGRLALARLLLERGAHEPARALLEAGPPTPAWRKRARALLEGARRARDEDQLDLLGGAPPPGLARAAAACVPTDAQCMTFTMAFGGREGVYARQWSSPTGKAGYSPIEAPFTPQVTRHHLMGDFTVGIYPLRSDLTVGWLCLDVDIRASELRQIRNRKRARELQRAAQTTACRLLDTCARHGLAALLEDSGHKGRHLWLLFESPIPAAAACRIGRFLVAETEGIAPETNVEVFPKQSRPGKRGLGNLVKLPLGVHQVTGRRCPFLRPDGVPIEDGHAALAAYSRPTLAALREVHERAGAARYGGAAPAALEVEARTGDDGVTLLPEGPPYRLEDDAEVDALRRGCAVLNDIIHRAQASRVLSNEDRLVLTYTLGHVARGADAVNAVLARVLNVDATKFLKSPLRGNPMSCPKIRGRVPMVTARVGCRCEFDVAASYPTPLLHVQMVRSHDRLERDPQELAEADVERLALDWVKAREDSARLGRVVTRIEAQLKAVIEARGGPLDVIGGRIVLTDSGLRFDQGDEKQ